MKNIFLSFSIFSLLLNTENTSLHAQSYKLDSLGINSNFDEFTPNFNREMLFFTSTRTNSNTPSTHLKDTDKGYQSHVFYQDLDSSVKRLPINVSNNEFIKGIAFRSSSNEAIVTLKSKATGNTVSTAQLFFANKKGDQWIIKDKGFKYNSYEHEILHPCISPDGTKLVFESDMKGGFGGFDIWYCEEKNGKWGKPINAGPIVNSDGNEVTPHISNDNTLYYSSNKGEGIGGYDVYSYDPVHNISNALPSPINSNRNDFGYINTGKSLEGYLSSDRTYNSYNIYSVKRVLERPKNCSPSLKEKKCFTFMDTEPFDDKMGFQYIWDFGDGKKSNLKTVRHCYEKHGTYNISLSLFNPEHMPFPEVVAESVVQTKKPSDFYLSSENDGILTFLEGETNETLKNTELFWFTESTAHVGDGTFDLDPENNGFYSVTTSMETEKGVECFSDTIFVNEENLPREKLLIILTQNGISKEYLKIISLYARQQGAKNAIVNFRKDVSEEVKKIVINQLYSKLRFNIQDTISDNESSFLIFSYE